jgi:hypothetical protein
MCAESDMRSPRRYFLLILLFVFTCDAHPQTDPLPSWNDGAAKKNLFTFVHKVTQESSPDCMPPAERPAVSGNDNTLRAEPPMYFQASFPIDRIAQKVVRPCTWECTP